MKARITIEYEPPWPEGLSLAELREREEEAWMTGAIAIPDFSPRWSSLSWWTVQSDRGEARPKAKRGRRLGQPHFVTK